jgi:sigma-E factor negative regulatory protein RseA
MERISAFMDGESSPAETYHAMQRLKQDSECDETWATFHLIGDAMRGDAMVQNNFTTRFHARIADEPTQLAPRRSIRKYANYALSAAASISAMAIVLTLVLVDNPVRPQIEQVSLNAGSALPVDLRVRPAAAPAQRKVNEYLMAHQEYSPSTAFQGVAPYVRTVSEAHDGTNR